MMSLGAKFIFSGCIYGLVGMLMGMAMGATHHFVYMPVHVHLNLLGWMAFMLYGLTYSVNTTLAGSKLAKIQFYMANAGLWLLIPALAILLSGNGNIVPVLIVGELLTVGSLLVFIINFFMHRHLV
jgi:cbb3-type cytochrome oxidase subunit 1